MADKLLSKFIIPVLQNTTWQTDFYPNSLSLFYTTQHDRQTSIQIHYPWFTQHNMTDKLLSKFIIPVLHNTTWQTDFYPNSLSLVYTTQHDRLLSKFIIPGLHNTTWQTNFYPNSLSLVYTTQHVRQTSIQIHYPWFIQHNMTDKRLSKFIIPALNNTT